MSSIRSLVTLLLWEQLARNFAVRSRRATGWLLAILFFAVIVGPALQISLTIRDLLSGLVEDWVPTFYSWLTMWGSATLFLLSCATASNEFTRHGSQGEEQIWRYLHPSRTGVAKLVVLVRAQLIPLAVLLIFTLAAISAFLPGQAALTHQNVLIGGDSLITLLTAFLAGLCLSSLLTRSAGSSLAKRRLAYGMAGVAGITFLMIFSPALFALLNRPEGSIVIVSGVTGFLEAYLRWLVTLNAAVAWGLLGLRCILLIGLGVLSVWTFSPTVETSPISSGFHYSGLGTGSGPLRQLLRAQFVVLSRSVRRMAALAMDLIVLAFFLPAIAPTTASQTELAGSLFLVFGLLYASFRGGLAAMLAVRGAGPLLITIRRLPGLPVRYLVARGIVAAAGGLFWSGVLLLMFVPFLEAAGVVRFAWVGPGSSVYFGLLMAGLEGIWHDGRGAMTGWARLVAGLGFVALATAVLLAVLLAGSIGMPFEVLLVPVGVVGLGIAAGVFLLGCGRMRRLES